ncbi:AEC family transporter [Evansella cellulosilytica]|uniref:Auxin Efflux Carrier n=1 Tax=Evansella cellulosilytica (strain ATCC 21833 / DSM 2522 / FERM P-1141 / JCM 9156 / N-4) TaxID=649639 RepID=E6U0E2_EVAC2|nr:AEC family transporter [Evansella cellulosilytica]ADU30258.1 Auxin Efflux Carrier [Evansella cellulosilytica DSM 2522]
MSFLLLFYEMGTLFVFAAIGFIVKYLKVIPETSNHVMVQLILYITLPALIIYSMDVTLYSNFLIDFFWLMILSCVMLLIATGLATLLSKNASLKQSQKAVFQALVIFGNQGFIGYAICYLLLGELGILYAAVFNLSFLIYIWSYGIYIFVKDKQKISIKNIFLTPGMASTICGIVILLLPYQLPLFINNVLYSIGSMTIPLSMLFIGCIIADNKFLLSQFILNKFLWIAVFTKLVIVPLSLFPSLIFTISLDVVMVAILIASMPSAPTTPMFAKKYAGDDIFASIGVSLSTLLSFITVPFLYFLLFLLI